MKWSLKIGRYAGIDVYLHVTFWILVAIVGYEHWHRFGTLTATLQGIALLIALFFCVLLHEFGHALMARRFGIKTQDITLLPIGGLARLERIPERPGQEIAVALAGPAVNVVIAGMLFAFLWLASALHPLETLGIAHGPFLVRLMAFNLFMVAFNMIPAFPMDGGRVLRALLALKMPHARATRIAATVGQGLAIVFVIVGFIGPKMLIIIAIFVWIGAAQEASFSELKSIMEGVRVRQAMLTDFHCVKPEDTLQHVAQLVMAGSQHDFPVIENGSFVGVLSRSALLQGLAQQGLEGQVANVMARDCERFDADDMLDTVLPRVRESKCAVVPVFSANRLVGLVNMENIAELLMIRSALATGREQAAPA
ncbi:MAG: site-2 protease family protein [Verrucomicrobiales bacterium]